jgi:hypothetical protein
MKLRLLYEYTTTARWAFLAARHNAFHAKAILVLTALALAPISTWPNTERSNVYVLAHECRTLGKQASCRKLAKIAVEDRDAAVRRTAVGWLTDQSLLGKIAVGDKDVDVRRTAVHWLTDQSILAKFAVGDKDGSVRSAAVDEVTDQSLLARIAVEDEDASVRSLALSKVKDQALVARVAVEDKDAHVRRNAVSELTDQSLLAKIAVDDKDGNIRAVAISKVTDQSLVAKVAVEDKDAHARCAAVQNMEDRSILAKIAVQDEDANVRSVALLKVNTVAPTELVATFTLLPPMMRFYRLSRLVDLSIPWNISGLRINDVAVQCETYKKDTEIARLDFVKFRRNGDFFYVTTKPFGEIQMKVLEEECHGGGSAQMPASCDYKCQIWATWRQQSEILDQLNRKDGK